MAARVRNLFNSPVFWWAVFSAIASSSIVTKDALRNNELGSAYYALELVTIWAGAGATVSARFKDSGTIYTPDWMPGPNKERIKESK